jgi:hypothetical protein
MFRGDTLLRSNVRATADCGACMALKADFKVGMSGRVKFQTVSTTCPVVLP